MATTADEQATYADSGPREPGQHGRALAGRVDGHAEPALVPTGLPLAQRPGGGGVPLSATPAPRLQRSSMPRDFSVSVGAAGGAERYISGPRPTRRQPMAGFEPTYVDIVDYILRITHRIWEEKDFGYIYDTYRANGRILGSDGPKADREQVIEETVAWSAMFPDLRLYGDEVIWAGDDQRGFSTSHRLSESGTHTGLGMLGRPTGRRFSHWCIANCVSVENEIFEEWVLDNTASVLQQLGLDLPALAREWGDAAPDTAFVLPRTGALGRLVDQGRPRSLPVPDDDVFDPEEQLRYALHLVWNWRSVSAIDRIYAPGVVFHGSTNRELHGTADVKQYHVTMLATFPDLHHSVDEVYWMGNDEDGYSVSVRWSVDATHRGDGLYGPATGRRVWFWGLTQYHLKNGRITEEWNLFNELEVLQQILRSEPAELGSSGLL